jgi:hypothetical protein
LIGNGSREPRQRKTAVVPTKSILTAANVPIIGAVLALQTAIAIGALSSLGGQTIGSTNSSEFAT